MNIIVTSNAHVLTSRHGCVEDCDTGPGIGDKRRGESQSGEEPRLTVIIRPRTQWSGQISPTLGFRSKILIVNFPDFATDFKGRVF